MNELEKIKKQLKKIEAELAKYYELFALDGTITTEEQEQLDKLSGQYLKVKKAYNQKAAEVKQGTKKTLNYKVIKDDTYSEISIKTGISVEKLREWNGYNDKQIPVGAELILEDPINLPLSEIEDYLAQKIKSQNLEDIKIAKLTVKKVPLDGKGWTSDDLPENGYSTGSGISAFKDLKQRQSYIDKVAKTANEYLKKFEAEFKTEYKALIAQEAVEGRNAGRKNFQQNPKLSWGAKKLSEVIEEDRSLAALVKKYGPGSKSNLEGDALHKLLIEKSGQTNQTLKNLNKWSKRLGTAGLAIGIAVSAINIYENPSFETVIGEVSAWIGGAVGTSIGVGIAAVAIGALGGSTGAVIIGALAAGAAVGYVIGYISHKLGSWLGKLIDSVVW
jgi:LysM repeat protein